MMLLSVDTVSLFKKRKIQNVIFTAAYNSTAQPNVCLKELNVPKHLCPTRFYRNQSIAFIFNPNGFPTI